MFTATRNTPKLILAALAAAMGTWSPEAQAQQQPPSSTVAPYYIAPPQPPGGRYTLGVYTQLVDMNTLPGGGAAFSNAAPSAGPDVAPPASPDVAPPAPTYSPRYIPPFPGGGGGAPPFYGLQITYLVPGGAAQRVGLEVGDIIVEANGRRTDNVNSLRQAIAYSNGYLNLRVRNVRPPHDFVSVPVNMNAYPGYPRPVPY